MFDYLVIGAGLIGSAATRYLSQTGAKVGLIGPAEPAAREQHTGVFASHYDQGRITRVLDTDVVWSQLAQRSIARYADLEARSGIRFHHPVGFLLIGPPRDHPRHQLHHAEAVGRQLGVPFDTLERPAFKQQFPYLDIPPGYCALHEQGGAGAINPRALVKAQLVIARSQQATLIRDTAVSTRKEGGLIVVGTLQGATYRCTKLLVAAGAFTPCFPVLPRTLALDVKAETVLLARVSSAEAKQLRDMPSIWYDFDWHPTLPYAYVLPPLRYPDGHDYLKIGADHDPDTTMDSFEAMNRYFRSPGSQVQRDRLWEVLHTMMPTLHRPPLQTLPCALAYTPHRKPMIDCIDSDGIYVAVGGCGAAAKSSDEIGRMAALLVHHGTWMSDLDQQHFEARFEEASS